MKIVGGIPARCPFKCFFKCFYSEYKNKYKHSKMFLVQALQGSVNLAGLTRSLIFYQSASGAFCREIFKGNNMKIFNRFTGEVIFESNADLSGTDLSGTDLRNADLRNADLSGTDLRNADLSNADLSNADLRNADLRNADLSGTDLSNADLRNADLSGTDLSNADLRNADLSGTDLRNADLRNADLSGTDLRNADLSGTDLSGTDLRNATGNMREIITLIIKKYHVVATKDAIQIGCENRSIKEWDSMSDEDIRVLDSGALEWWKKYKEFIFMEVRLSFLEGEA